MLSSLVNYINSFKILRKIAFNYKTKVSFYHLMAKLTMTELSVGVSLLEIREFEKHGNALTAIKTPLYFVYNDMISRLQSGASVANAVGDYVPDNDRMMISAFEEDDISKGFNDLVEYNESLKDMQKAFTKAVTYPMMLITVFIGILSYFSLVLVPQLTVTMTDDTPLSLVSQIMIGMSKYFWVWFPAITGSIVAIFVFLIWALPNMNNRLRIKLEGIPPFSMYRIKMGCSFLTALNSLTKSGMQQSQAIAKMEKEAKPYLKSRLVVISRLLHEGKPLGAALIDSKQNFPDKTMLKPIAILSKRGVFEESLDKMTKDLNEDGLEIVEKQAGILRLFLTVVLMFGILFCFSSIYSISQDMAAAAQVKK